MITDPNTEMTVILILLFTKHFIVDFPLQTLYMLHKDDKDGWVKPLAAHCGLHGAATAVLLIPFIGWWAPLLGLMDAVIHFIVDGWKSRKTSYQISDKRFWTALGLDQWLHGITYIQIAFLASGTVS